MEKKKVNILRSESNMIFNVVRYNFVYNLVQRDDDLMKSRNM